MTSIFLIDKSANSVGCEANVFGKYPKNNFIFSAYASLGPFFKIFNSNEYKDWKLFWNNFKNWNN